MAYSRDACIEIREDREGLERDRESGGTIDRLQKDWQDTIYGAMADGLSQTNEIARGGRGDRERAREIQRELEGARESQDGDIELFRQLVYGQTVRQTDGHYQFLKLLSRLKNL